MVIYNAIEIADYYSSIVGFEIGTLLALIFVVAFCAALVVALSLHELAHGLAALKNGDMTAKYEGRLTANPFKHFDPYGLLMMFLVGFGWAKPVPINPYNFKNYKKGMIETSIAGVVTNAILAIVFSLLGALLNLVPMVEVNFGFYLLFALKRFLDLSVLFNVNFMLFNLLPLFPLDGFRLLEALLPDGNRVVAFLRKYGNTILLALILFGFVTDMIGVNLSPLNLYIKYVGGWIIKGLNALWRLIGLPV